MRPPGAPVIPSRTVSLGSVPPGDGRRACPEPAAARAPAAMPRPIARSRPSQGWSPRGTGHRRRWAPAEVGIAGCAGAAAAVAAAPDALACGDGRRIATAPSTSAARTTVPPASARRPTGGAWRWRQLPAARPPPAPPPSSPRARKRRAPGRHRSAPARPGGVRAAPALAP